VAPLLISNLKTCAAPAGVQILRYRHCGTSLVKLCAGRRSQMSRLNRAVAFSTQSDSHDGRQPIVAPRGSIYALDRSCCAGGVYGYVSNGDDRRSRAGAVSSAAVTSTGTLSGAAIGAALATIIFAKPATAMPPIRAVRNERLCNGSLLEVRVPTALSRGGI
jgi:hypothetical protein